jgi:hypothetical protein
MTQALSGASPLPLVVEPGDAVDSKTEACYRKVPQLPS